MVHETEHLWTSEDNSVKLVLSFHFYVGSRGQNQVAQFTQQVLWLAESSVQSLENLESAIEEFAEKGLLKLKVHVF